MLTKRVLDRIRSGPQQDERLARLSQQERRILDLLAEGLTNRQIAARLFLAEKTVKNYVSNLLTKLGMSRRTEAAAFAAYLRARHLAPQVTARLPARSLQCSAATADGSARLRPGRLQTCNHVADRSEPSSQLARTTSISRLRSILSPTTSPPVSRAALKSTPKSLRFIWPVAENPARVPP